MPHAPSVGSVLPFSKNMSNIFTSVASGITPRTIFGNQRHTRIYFYKLNYIKTNFTYYNGNAESSILIDHSVVLIGGLKIKSEIR